MRNIIFIALLCIGSFSPIIKAQKSTTAESKEWLIQESRRQYRDKDYNAALMTINRLLDSPLNPELKEEAEFLKATALYACNYKHGQKVVNDYLSKYPNSVWANNLHAILGEYYYFEKEFTSAVAEFEKSNLNLLPIEQKDRMLLHYALSLLQCDRDQQAISILSALRQSSKQYSKDAIFYMACNDYYNDKLQEAYDGFKSIEMDNKFYLDVPYYLGAIYLKKGEYVRAEKLAELFIQHNKHTKQTIAMYQILGSSYFGQNKFTEAVAPLKQYIDQSEKPQRIAYYQLGLCYYENMEYKASVGMLDKTTDTKDMIAQNAYLHLGLCQLKLDDTTKARMDFEQAASMNFDITIKEEALYNYALCIHQTRYSPFAESVKVFERFLNEFPSSRHRNQVAKYLVEVYMNTRNYDVALQSINKIRQPDRSILEAKQNILYRLGIQAFIDKKYSQAISFMNQSLELEQYNGSTKADALYWKAEAFYRLNDYAAATQAFQAAISAGGTNTAQALYGLGYSQFQTKQYNAALTHFNRFIQVTPSSQNNALHADAYNRIGDCYFYQRNYTTAGEYYKKSSETDNSFGDYALYRNALTKGLHKNYNEKVETLNRLISQYPKSSYAEQAYYEMGRAFLEQKKNEQAVESFRKLIHNYPSSSLARRAAAETAMIYYQNNDNPRAITAYKEVIQKYPQSEEAQIAAQDLKNIYVEQGKIEEFAQYAAKTPGMRTIESSERDTLTYTGAERIYSRGEIAEAKKSFTNYLTQFPQGSFTLDAHYYLGMISYNEKAMEQALENFAKVIEFPDNKYSEEAMALSSDILYKAAQYDKAMILYKQLIARTNNAERRIACQMNLLRSAYNINASEEVLAVASDLMKQGNINPEWEREIRYDRAKTLLKTGKADDATTDLTELSKDTRTLQGAEAKYLLAEHFYSIKDNAKAEKIILNYIEESTPHSYWLAKSFLLLSDIYVRMDKKMEAKQYLLSLKNNYSGNDDIASLIESKLSALGVEEKK